MTNLRNLNTLVVSVDSCLSSTVKLNTFFIPLTNSCQIKDLNDLVTKDNRYLGLETNKPNRTP